MTQVEPESIQVSAKPLRVGVLINPIAGMGGQVGLKGTDGVVDEARARGAVPKAKQRAQQFLHALSVCADAVHVLTIAGAMGADALDDAHEFSVTILPDMSKAEASSADDMKAAAKVLVTQALDVLCFVGGDGTARDMVDAELGAVPIIGIPAGVKMYSGVFAVSPESAAHIIQAWTAGKPMNIVASQVRDIDESAMRANQVKTQFYGELWTPHVRLMQSIKTALQDDQAVMQQDIADYVVEQLIGAERHVYSIIGPGSTTATLKSQLEGTPSLLGVDVYRNYEQLAKDVWSAPILSLLDREQSAQSLEWVCYLFVTFTAGQGFLFGRGNQQLCAQLIAHIGKDNIRVLATQDKLDSLRSRPMLIDTGSKVLDAELSGYLQVITGYDETVLYPVKAASDFIDHEVAGE